MQDQFSAWHVFLTQSYIPGIATLQFSPLCTTTLSVVLHFLGNATLDDRYIRKVINWVCERTIILCVMGDSQTGARGSMTQTVTTTVAPTQRVEVVLGEQQAGSNPPPQVLIVWIALMQAQSQPNIIHQRLASCQSISRIPQEF